MFEFFLILGKVSAIIADVAAIIVFIIEKKR